MSETSESPETSTNEAMSGGMKAFVRALGLFFVGLKYLIIVIFIAGFFQGIFFVREHEEAMLFRFGRLVRKGPDQEAILTSGRLHWAWPYPIDTVDRIPARRPITLTTNQFWLKVEPNQIDPGSAETQADGETGLAEGQDGYALTGDANIIHMQWAVVYTVNNAENYYLDFFSGEIERSDREGRTTTTRENIAERLILHSLESAALAEVATWTVEDVLFKARSVGGDDGEGEARRELLTTAVQRRFERLLADLDLGIDVHQVMMEPMPPRATITAFREVNDAANEYRTLIDEARGYQQRVVAEAEGRASEILAEARSYRTRVVASVEADANYFSTVLSEYERNPRTMLVALYTDTIREVLGQVGGRYVVHAGKGDREFRLLINPEPERPVENNNDNPMR